MVSKISIKASIILFCTLCIGVLANAQDEMDSTAPSLDNTEAVETTEEPTDPPATDVVVSDLSAGQSLFTGEIRFENRGPACISCHNLDIDASITGGTLAKDLTNAHSRLGDAGISAMLSAPPFPAMRSAYESNSLTDQEIANINAFLKEVDGAKYESSSTNYNTLMAITGFLGLIAILIIISLLWSNRKKHAVKRDIFNRQIKST
jgi:mono/diheme cytochrome c family protein